MDSVYIYQLVLRPCVGAANLRLVPINVHDEHAVQLMKFERAMAAKTKTKHYYSAHNIATRVSFGT